ncbi:MAG: hypothetical protein IIB81_05235, partial [Nanoarchaeota archaeon]|nr:hypothetical protein [Nanoarchaeota archaeon]
MKSRISLVKMNPLLSKFIIPLIIVSIILTVIMDYVISAQIKDSELSRAQRITAQQISSEAGEHIPKDAFLATDPSEYNEDFEHFVDIVMNSEVIKIKILNDRGSIIYSTSKGDIGMISLSKGVKGALSGKDM